MASFGRAFLEVFPCSDHLLQYRHPTLASNIGTLHHGQRPYYPALLQWLHSFAHLVPCGEGADLWRGDCRGAGPAWLPAWVGDALSDAASVRGARLPAL